MDLFRVETDRDLARVSFDCGTINTVSSIALAELGSVVETIHRAHVARPLRGVLLKGNRFGLGTGADITELALATREQFEAMLDLAHTTLHAIEESPLPWVAIIDGVALGGAYELALACHGIVATERSTVGLPEVQLHLIPGLGGTQRLPRRMPLLHRRDPMGKDGALSVILGGKMLQARRAWAVRMIDAVVPRGQDPDGLATRFLTEQLPSLRRPSPTEVNDPVTVQRLVEEATCGRARPRAPHIAAEVMMEGLPLPLRQAVSLERDAFIELAISTEGRAGARHFLVRQRVCQPPIGDRSPQPLTAIGVEGVEAPEGRVVARLALEAGYRVVGRTAAAGRSEPTIADQNDMICVDGIQHTQQLEALFDCDLVIDCRPADAVGLADLYGRLGAGLRRGALLAAADASRARTLTAQFQAGGGDPRRILGMRFTAATFGPTRNVVEISTPDGVESDTLAAAHQFARGLEQIPIRVTGPLSGGLIDTGFVACLLAAERLFEEGTPIDAIDSALSAEILPLGPFQLADQIGLECVGQMIARSARSSVATGGLLGRLLEAGRSGRAKGAGYYDYVGDDRATAAPVAPPRMRPVPAEEIVARCGEALYAYACSLCERGMVATQEECDLAFVLGLGFASHLGGPVSYGENQGWRIA